MRWELKDIVFGRPVFIDHHAEGSERLCMSTLGRIAFVTPETVEKIVNKILELSMQIEQLQKGGTNAENKNQH